MSLRSHYRLLYDGWVTSIVTRRDKDKAILPVCSPFLEVDSLV